MDAPSARPWLIAIAIGVFRMAAAQEPWAVRVETYIQGTGSAAIWNDPSTALGRPETLTYDVGDTFGNPTTTVVPVYPAFQIDQVVSIGEGGSLVLEMGKPITNDPANPYGMDLLVFVYTYFAEGGAYDSAANDPTTYTLPDAATIALWNENKKGRVSVSEDGTTWFTFPSKQDLVRMMPTLGRIWDGATWTADTDPTLPPDPDLTLADVAGMKLDELCRRYRGGAGGVGYDLDELIVPEGQSLPGEFHYVKIEVPDDGTSTAFRVEIDAVTVVSPVSAFVRWQQTHYEWVGDPELEVSGANGDGDPFDNWQEFARGGNPAEEETELPLPALSVSSAGLAFELPTALAVEAPWRVQATTTPAEETSWMDLDPQPAPVDVPTPGGVTRTFPLPAPESGAMLYRLQLEQAL